MVPYCEYFAFCQFIINCRLKRFTNAKIVRGHKVRRYFRSPQAAGAQPYSYSWLQEVPVGYSAVRANKLLQWFFSGLWAGAVWAGSHAARHTTRKEHVTVTRYGVRVMQMAPTGEKCGQSVGNGVWELRSLWVRSCEKE